MYTKDCSKCIHNAVCETAKACDGYGIGCKHFNQGWISVKERLPKPYETVLTCRQMLLNGTKTICIECLSISYGETPVWGKDYKTWKSKVTHWMPLPQPPKGE